MDREERLQALNKIEGQLSQYLAADKKNWIQTYSLRHPEMNLVLR